MTKRKLITFILVALSLFSVMMTLIIIFSDTVARYGAIVSSVSTFFYLTFNCFVVWMNINIQNSTIRPYLAMGFELFDAGKGQFTIKNIGNVVGIIKSIRFEAQWLEQYFDQTPELTESEKKFLRELKSTHIVISPKSKVILKPVLEPQKIIDGQFPNEVKIYIRFTSTYKQTYEKEIVLDFMQFNEMIIYSDDAISGGAASII